MHRPTLFMSDAEVAAIGEGLVHRTLPRSDWTHAAHFAAALWLIETGRSSAMAAAIRRYNEATGVANTETSGYHATITQASMRAARAFRRAQKDKALFEVCNALMVSPYGASNWLLAHWSRERLFSAEARRRWVTPDIRLLILGATGGWKAPAVSGIRAGAR